MTAQQDLERTLQLLNLERHADLEQYRQKVLLTPLHRKTDEGICWYPVKLKRDYIGTGERLIIEVERTSHLDQPHVFQSGKVVSVFSNANNTPEKDHMGGVINYVRDNTMVITLNQDELPDWIDLGLLGVDVMFDEMTYREMEVALKKVIQAEDNRVAHLRNVLLGYDKPAFDTRNNISALEKLNPSQLGALNHALSAIDVGIIHGPPGTGKTTTLVHAIMRTVKDETQVLVCAPSNAAVDLLVDKLSEKDLRVVRIGHPARVTEQTLSKTLDAQIAAHENYKELRNMRKRMEQLRGMASKYKRHFGYAEKQQRKLLRQEANSLKADADVLEFYIIKDILQKSDVVAATLVGASHPTLRGKKYGTVFIDEAAQALEPACWIPVLRCERVIFAGDHFQLPPTIKSMEAARAGLAETLFEKCIRFHPQTARMLSVQYRMHTDIMQFSSSYFYNNQLVADTSVASHALPDEAPVEFIDTAGCGYTEQQDPETLSRFNVEEATLVTKLLERLVERIGDRQWLETGYSIGVITPYKAQTECIARSLEKSSMLNELSHLIAVNTVDAFQGQERDVILISFVRSNDKGEVGFLSDIRRTNVALTRARKKLILVGNTATLGSHDFYTALIEYVQKKGYYKSAYEFIS